MGLRENRYQAGLIKKLKKLYPGLVILKNDSGYLQGVPDLILLYNDKWAMLEVKAYSGAPSQPNQDYYINLFDSMSFAAFINPDNEEDILHELQIALQS